jgi:hypothetical protein
MKANGLVRRFRRIETTEGQTEADGPFGGGHESRQHENGAHSQRAAKLFLAATQFHESDL